MKINWIKAIGAALLGTALLAAAGCGGAANSSSKSAQGEANQKKVLKYRVMPTATSDLFEAGVKPILEKKGYKLEAVKITDSVQRELALNDGEIDFHVDAHKAYLDAINKKQGTTLTAVLPLPTVPTGLYPGKKSKLEEVADGDTIALPNDASNVARAYQILNNLGWIKLDPKKDHNHVTQKDIVENPKHLKFQEMRGPSIASIRTDVDYIILRGSDAYNAKIDFNSALFGENVKDIDPAMMIALCVNEKNKDAPWVKDIIAAYKSPEFKDFMKTQSKFWILPDYLR